MRAVADLREIWNEGELPLGYTEETLMGRHSSKPRNRNIANTMFKAGFIDTWGRGYMKIRDGFEAAGIPMPKVQNFCGGVQVSVQRTKFMKMTNASDDVTSLSQVVSQVDDKDLSLLTEVFISLQKERTLAELMAEFKQVNRGRFKSSCLDILIRAGLATPKIGRASCRERV